VHPEVAKYLLIIGELRFSTDAPPIGHVTKHLQTTHADDNAAIRWARSKVPHPEKACPAVPMVLWRIEATGREFVWMRAV
jgi:hypothetical protein